VQHLHASEAFDERLNFEHGDLSIRYTYTVCRNFPVMPWIAHFYTGLGAATALAAALAVFNGDYRAAFLWLGLQIAIDATDGVLARALRVKERLPFFDGARLDDIIDYLTYVFVPVLLLLRAELLPAEWGVWVGVAVLLASGYGFSQTAAKIKTTDHFFTGFPSYWNIVALYMYLLETRPLVNAAILLVFALLVFVPLRYVYPSRTVTLRGLTNVMAAGWAVLLIWSVWRLPERGGPWITISLAFPIYYFVLSLWLDWQSRSRAQYS
jgi:phosphatidylcholine synthase